MNWTNPADMHPAPEVATNEAMEFDHVVRVSGGRIVGDTLDVYAPSLYWHEGLGHELEGGEGWELMTGYSGQHGYSGPIMHESEFIGGRMERDILAHDGLYVALVCYCMEPDEDGEQEVAGWAVARMLHDCRDDGGMQATCDACDALGYNDAANGPDY